tara:strand:- start:484 stop:1020 length:537 start_codon:yes stop_codon:yes gene_type:complete
MMRVELNINTIYDLALNPDINCFGLSGSNVVFKSSTEQYLSKISDVEMKLLRQSRGLFSLFKREYMQVMLVTKTGESLFSKIIKGTRHSVSHFQEIKNLCYELIFRAKKQGLEAQHIVVMHTHLGDQYVTEDKNGLIINARALSQTDIKTVRRMKPFIDYPIIIKSICENGLSYSVKI